MAFRVAILAALGSLVLCAAPVRAHDDPLRPGHRHSFGELEMRPRSHVPPEAKGLVVILAFKYDSRFRKFRAQLKLDEKLPFGIPVHCYLYFNQWLFGRASKRFHTRNPTVEFGPYGSRRNLLPGMYHFVFHFSLGLLHRDHRRKELESSGLPPHFVLVSGLRVGDLQKERNLRDRENALVVTAAGRCRKLLDEWRLFVNSFELGSGDEASRKPVVPPAASVGPRGMSKSNASPPRFASPIKRKEFVDKVEVLLFKFAQLRRKLREVKMDIKRYEKSVWAPYSGFVVTRLIPEGIADKVNLYARQTANRLFRAAGRSVPWQFTLVGFEAGQEPEFTYASYSKALAEVYSNMHLAASELAKVRKEKLEVQGHLKAHEKRLALLEAKVAELEKTENPERDAFVRWHSGWETRLDEHILVLRRAMAGEVMLVRSYQDLLHVGYDLKIMGLVFWRDLYKSMNWQLPADRAKDFASVAKETMASRKKSYLDLVRRLRERLDLGAREKEAGGKQGGGRGR